MKCLSFLLVFCLLFSSFVACGSNVDNGVYNKIDILVTVTGKTNNKILDDGKGGLYAQVFFSFNVQNCTTKDIKGVQGILVAYRMIGEEKIFECKCDFVDNIIPSGGMISISDMAVTIDSIFGNDGTGIYRYSYEDLIFEYKVIKFVYTDGIVGFSQNDISNSLNRDQTLVEVVDKNSFMNVNSETVTFKFSLSNKTKKNIKSIHGTLKVRNMFGERIFLLRYDFNNLAFLPNTRMYIISKGIVINTFVDGEYTLYNTPFSNLTFSYDISKIVYTDGTFEMF